MIEDLRAIKRRDPAAKNLVEVFLLYPGFHALFYHRIAGFFFRHKLFFAARCISQMSRFLTGIEIHPGAKIGRGLFIDHGSGVVIGETTQIGDDCTIYQGVTLGGTGKEKGKRHPTIGNNVLIGSGAKVLGPLNVYDNAKIAANAVVLNDVPENSTVAGVPARVVKKDERRISPSTELDHVHIPDPISQQFCQMSAQMEGLKKQIAKLKEGENDDEAL